ncbi:MAG TPA: PadR family transcriptional regulator [Solibacterales bacterium]|nr:PadR family transcriptional regulator [Bryobacterales bacterium]
MGRPEERDELLRGTLYLLILKTLVREPMHGWGIAERIQAISEDALTVEEGSLYPALQRMLLKGWVTAEWGLSQNNRRARYYSITAAGRRQLELELSQYSRVTGAIAKVLATA